MKLKMKHFARTIFLALLSNLFLAKFSLATLYAKENAFKVNGKVFTTKDLQKLEKDKFYQIEKEKFQLIEYLAKQTYLDAYFEKLAKTKNLTSEAAREQYMAKNVKISESELKQTIEKFKNHPKLKELSEKEKKDQVRMFLKSQGEQEVLQALLSEGQKSGELQVLYERPKEPIYTVTVNNKDHVRYRADSKNPEKPIKCDGDNCPITIVEFSEFQCPYCAKILPTAKRVMEEYKGQIRWVVRDFPLDFHDRAKPAAIAAKCAGKQGKFWDMYTVLFENQRDLSDNDFTNYAKKIDLDEKKFKSCVGNASEMEKLIAENMQEGMKLGVTGTPAFFINGRRLSGALPFEDFKRIIDEEIKNQESSKKKA